MIDFLISILLSVGNVGAFAILAVGIVMIYRASKVLNLAHGAMVMFPPYVVLILNAGEPSFSKRLLACAIPAATVGPLLASLVGKRAPSLRLGPVRLSPKGVRTVLGLVGSLAALYALLGIARTGIPLLPALVLGIAAGGALGYLVERVFVRTLRAQGPTAQTVGTVAALGLMVATAAKIFGSQVLTSAKVFPEGGFDIAQSFVSYGQIALFVISLGITFGLILLFQKTDIGLIMRGTAENRRAASLMGVDPDKITAITWVMGGALAGISGILLASITNLHPYVLSLQALPAFVGALLGGMGSLSGAVAGSAIVAVTMSVIPSLGPLQKLEGGAQLFLTIAAVGAMVTRGQRIVGGDVRSESIAAAGGRGIRRGLGGLDAGKRPLAALGTIVFLSFPLLADDVLTSAMTQAARNAMLAASLVILIGWVGQISLGQAALYGVGAYMTGWIAGGLNIPFPLSLPLAALSAAGVAMLLGVVAVRVRGLFLAVATLIFSWMGSEFLFRQQWFIKHYTIEATTIGTPGTVPYFDFSADPTTFYYVAWAIAAIGLFAAANLRDSKTGRAFFAVQGSEMAAASLGVDVPRYKQMAFAVSGFLAGAAGNLLMTSANTVGPDDFTFNRSLLFVSFAVVGGLRSLGGAVGAGVVFALLDQFVFFRVQALSGYLEVVSAGLLALVLLAYPGGLAGLGSQLAHLLGRWRFLVRMLTRADRLMDTFMADLTWAKRRLGEKVRERLEAPALAHMGSLAVEAGATTNGHSANGHAAPETTEAREVPRDADGRRATDPIVRADAITVRFGGLTAVDNNSMEVREGEIVGLIGPNGAGKTVTFNSIAGIVTPTEGRIFLYGQDVTDRPVHERARLGIARTFQVLQLFPALTVMDNLLVATHLHNQTGLLSHVTAAESAVNAEAEARRRVHEIVALLGLEDIVDKVPGDLPFGTLRTVEVARALVTGLKFVMLDEAFSGLDDTETENLVRTLLKVRELGITILLIEHDVKLVMSVSDYVYVLDRGRLIAHGPPAQVQRDPSVIAAYLGKAPEDAAEPAEVNA